MKNDGVLCLLRENGGRKESTRLTYAFGLSDVADKGKK